VHAILLAGAGDPERALELVWLACRLDLDDLTGTSAGGLHVATMGGVWQALTTGFLGLRPSGDALGLDPRLPEAWDAVELRLRHRGRRLRVRAGHDQLKLATDGPVPVRLPGLPARTVTAPGASWQRAGQEWQEGPRPNLGPSASRQGPPDPEAAGRSADAAAGRTGEARMGGMRPPRA
jgi:Glycosyl hydrolase family 65, C-terminal domain/Glycosyl hydrolase family 65 central catalytic domain